MGGIDMDIYKLIGWLGASYYMYVDMDMDIYKYRYRYR